MKVRTTKVLKFFLLTAFAVTLLTIFVPRVYNVPELQKQAGTQHWQLRTGSRIAFTLVVAKTKKRPLPIVYLHGGPGGHVHDGLIKSLAPLAEDGYDIYFYDQIGSGSSGRLENITDYTVDRHIRDLGAITEKLGGKVILIGQSWGAILATIFMARYPESTERLVLTCPGPIFPMNGELKKIQAPDSIRLQAPFFTNAQGNRKVNNLRMKAIGLFASSFGWKLASDKEADGFATYSDYEVNKSTICDTANILEMEAGSGYYSRIRTFKNLLEVKDYRPELRRIKTPVLVIKGECDNQPWGNTKEYLDVFQNHRLTIIPGAGHFLWVEQPALSLNAIREFLIDPVPVPDSTFARSD